MRSNQQLSHYARIVGKLCRLPSPAPTEFLTTAAAHGQLCGTPRARERNYHGIIKVGRDFQDQ